MGIIKDAIALALRVGQLYVPVDTQFMFHGSP